MTLEITARVRAIKPSPTLGMAAEAAALRAEGRDIVDLSAGEPDFETPEHIKAAAREALARGLTKYTAGRRHPRAEGRHPREVPARERPHLRDATR